MKNFITPILAASSLFLLTGTGFAQTAPIRMGQTTTMQAIEQTDSALARQTQRLSALESTLQELTGRMETLEFNLNQSNLAREDLERENSVLRERLARLEGKVEQLSSRSVAMNRDIQVQPRPSGQSVTSSSTYSTERGPSWSGTSSGRVVTSQGPRELRGGPETSPPTGRTLSTIPSRTEGTTTVRTTTSEGLGTIPASSLPGEAGALFELGKNRLVTFDYAGAESAFRAFLDAFGDDPQAGEAHYWLGEALYQQGDHAGSARFFTDMLKNYPDDPRRGEALVKLSRSLREVGETERACTFLSRFNEVAPNASNVLRQRVVQEQTLSNCS